MSEFGGLWKHEKTQHMHFHWLGLASVTLLHLTFLGGSDLNFPWEKSPLGQESVCCLAQSIDVPLPFCVLFGTVHRRAFTVLCVVWHSPDLYHFVCCLAQSIDMPLPFCVLFGTVHRRAFTILCVVWHSP